MNLVSWYILRVENFNIIINLILFSFIMRHMFVYII
jgi:hypothetical protein